MAKGIANVAEGTQKDESSAWESAIWLSIHLEQESSRDINAFK